MSDSSSQPAPTRFDRLLPPGGPVGAQEIVEELGLFARTASAPARRPRVLLNMVSTLDGRATLGGRSGPIGGQADRELFHALRTAVDAVMVGAGTARAERYGRIIREGRARELRRARGLEEEPLACIVSGRLALSADLPLLADPRARVAILTASQASLDTNVRARVDYVRAAQAGRLDLPRALAQLHERLAIETVLCEGGPHLNTQLLSAGLVDELFLSLAPKLVGGDASGEALRILAGADLSPIPELHLLGVHEHESHLFLRYGVRGEDERRGGSTGREGSGVAGGEDVSGGGAPAEGGGSGLTS